MGDPALREAYQRQVLLVYRSLILLILLGFVEVGSRTIEYFGPRTFVFRQFDDVLGVSLVPNAAGIHRHCFDGYISINSHGMRDAARQLDKPARVLRIGVFGDSIIEGAHVYPDQVASRRLETRLNDEICSAKCEVLNFGVGGYGTLQEWLHYKRDGRQFGLDMVVLLFIGNDVDNNLPQTSSFDENFYYAPYLSLNEDGRDELHPPVKPRFYGILQFGMEHSAFFRFAYKTYYHFLYQTNRFSSDTLTFDVRDGLALRPDYLTRESALGRAGWLVTEHLLDNFASDVRKDGADFVVFHSGYDIPNPTERDREIVKGYQKATGFTVDFQFGRKWFANFSRRTGTPVFDWEIYKTDYVVKKRLYNVGLGYSCDGHFNPEGHAVLADFLFEKLAPLVRAKLSNGAAQ